MTAVAVESHRKSWRFPFVPSSKLETANNCDLGNAGFDECEAAHVRHRHRVSVLLDNSEAFPRQRVGVPSPALRRSLDNAPTFPRQCIGVPSQRA
jgi:hypothetical protein